jgi:hypothetical protein
MFNVKKKLTRIHKNLLEQRFKKDLNDSVNNSINKFDKLMIEINNNNKKKQDIENILNETRIIKTAEHIQNNYNLKYHNLIFIFSVVSIGALLFYKSI